MIIGMNVAGCKKGSDSRMSLLYVHGAGRGISGLWRFGSQNKPTATLAFFRFHPAIFTNAALFILKTS